MARSRWTGMVPWPLVRALDRDEVVSRLNATAQYANSLPAAQDTLAVIGFCWGGSTSFAYAAAQPNLSAAVVYYGSSPSAEALARIQAPVLALYGGDDARVNKTISARGDGDENGWARVTSRRFTTVPATGFCGLRRLGTEPICGPASERGPETIGFLRKELGR